MENKHWYDRKYPHDLEGTYVRVTMSNGAVVYGDLHDDCIGTMSVSTGDTLTGGITVLVSTPHGIFPADGTKEICRLWDGKVWRRRTEKDSGIADAICVNDKLYTVDSEVYDQDNNTFYEIVNKQSSSGTMLRMRFPAESVTARLMLVSGRPKDPGIYEGADGSLWCIAKEQYWRIIRPDYTVWNRIKADVPPEAYPMHRVSDL